MPKHKQAGQTTVLTKIPAKITRKRLQCRSHPQRSLGSHASPDRHAAQRATPDAGETLSLSSFAPAFLTHHNGPEFAAQAVKVWIAAVGAKTADIEPE